MIKKTDTILDEIVSKVKSHLHEKKKSTSIQDMVNLAKKESRVIISLSERIYSDPKSLTLDFNSSLV